MRPPPSERVEAADRRGDLFGRAVALHPHRPHQHVARKAVGQPVQDVADDGAGGRRDDADDRGQERQELLARLVEQAFGGELLLALLEQRHQRAEARRLQRLDHDLVGAAARIGREPAGGDDFEPLLRLDPHAAEGAAPHHRIDAGGLVLQGEIGMAGRMRPAIAGDFAAHPHMAVAVLDGALERGRKLGHRPFRNIDARLVGRFLHRFVRHGCLDGAPA